MEAEDYVCLILYYGREKMYANMHKLSVDVLTKFPKQRVFTLLNGFALTLGERMTEACRVLSNLKCVPEYSCAALMALNYACKQEQLQTEHILAKIDKNFKHNSACSSALTFYYAALFNFLIGNYETAEQLNAHALDISHNSCELSIILKAWLQLKHFKQLNKLPFAIEYVLQLECGNIDGSLCKVQYLCLMHAYDQAINELTKLSMRYPETSIPLMEKLHIHLATRDWEQAQETTLRIINLEPQNVMALTTKTILLLCRDSNFAMALQTLAHLCTASCLIECGNQLLVWHVCQLVASICARQQQLLQLTMQTLQKLIQDNAAAASNVHILNEIGQQYLLLNKAPQAYRSFQAVLKLQRNNSKALCGLAKCEQLEKESDQIEFISNLTGSEHTAEFLLILAQTQTNEEAALPLLIEAGNLHLAALKNQTFGLNYLRALNVQFVMELTVEFIKCMPAVVLEEQQQHLVNLEKYQLHMQHCVCLLDNVLRVCPAHLHAIYLRSILHMINGNQQLAMQLLQQLTTHEQLHFNDAHLLLAYVQIKQQQYVQAKRTLEQILSIDFGVRNVAFYHYLLGQILQQQQQQSTDDLIEAKKCYLTVLQILGQPSLTQMETRVHFPALINLNNNKNKVIVYLQLIQTLRSLEDIPASEHYMQLAHEEFFGTAEEGKLLIAQAEYLLLKFEYTKALKLLNTIEPTQTYYLQSRILLANIYLKYCKNRVLFAKCFQEITEIHPHLDSYLMLGEAYLSIQEVDLAIDIYERAFNCNPSYTLLAKKLGQAYIKTHQYSKAIAHYEQALKHTNNSTLKLDLAELFMFLKQYKRAEQCLAENLDVSKTDCDEVNLVEHTQQLLLLAKIQEKLQNTTLSLQILKIALKNQLKGESTLTQQQTATRICMLLAQQYVRLGNLQQAANYYQECLKWLPKDMKVLSCLAQLYMQMNSMEECAEICNELLTLDANNQHANVMLADIWFRKMDFSQAAQQFSKLLAKQPNHWTALARLIQSLRRLGQLEDCVPLIAHAESSLVEKSHISGLIYCKGLYDWYAGNLHKALQHFNQVRQDIEWGQQATSNMIEIYLHQHEDIIYDAASETYIFNTKQENSEDDLKLLSTAKILLQHLHNAGPQKPFEVYNIKLLENLLLLAANEEEGIEMAMQNLNDMLECTENAHKVGLVYGLVVAQLKLNNLPEAKRHIKSILHMPWSFEESTYLEGCYLYMSFIYIQQDKPDAAMHFLKRILELDKSCVKAYELAGFISEKFDMFSEAANYYESAWKLCCQHKPYVGYKLVCYLLKLKRYADAANISQQVLKYHPEFALNQHELFNKSLQYLRN